MKTLFPNGIAPAPYELLLHLFREAPSIFAAPVAMPATIPVRFEPGRERALPNLDKYVSTKEAAKLPGIGRRAVSMRIKQGQLSAIRKGSRWRVERASIESAK